MNLNSDESKKFIDNLEKWLEKWAKDTYDIQEVKCEPLFLWVFDYADGNIYRYRIKNVTFDDEYTYETYIYEAGHILDDIEYMVTSEQMFIDGN